MKKNIVLLLILLSYSFSSIPIYANTKNNSSFNENKLNSEGVVSTVTVGTINYLDSAGNQLQDSEDVSSSVGETFNLKPPAEITGYKLDFSKSNLILTSAGSPQQTTIQDMMTSLGKDSIGELIAHLNSQTIAPGTESAVLNYVYIKVDSQVGKVTEKHVDKNGTLLGTSEPLGGKSTPSISGKKYPKTGDRPGESFMISILGIFLTTVVLLNMKLKKAKGNRMGSVAKFSRKII